jgi:hypothetical protein
MREGRIISSEYEDNDILIEADIPLIWSIKLHLLYGGKDGAVTSIAD